MTIPSYQPVPPDSVRVWWGYKKAGLSHKKFFKRLGTVFIPGTFQIQCKLGLTAYLPAVLPQVKPETIPDEIALVFYRSQQSYKMARKSTAGRAYGYLHTTVFNFNDPYRSRSDFPKRYTDRAQTNTPYYLFENEVDWSFGASRVLVGSRQPSQSAELFIQSVEAHIQRILSNPPTGIDNAYFVISDHFVLFWEHWATEVNNNDSRPGIVNGLTEVASPVLLKTSQPLGIDAGLFDDYEGKKIKGGECMNIRYKQNRPAITDRIPVYGLHGESHAAPPDTEVSYLAALGAGAEGIVLGTHLTQDQTLVCYPNKLVEHAGLPSTPICTMDAATFNQLDAGRNFRSSVLDKDNRPTGEYGADTPWDAATDYRRISHPTLEDILRFFGRRTSIMLLIDDSDNAAAIARSCMELLQKTGLEKRVTVLTHAAGCEVFRDNSPDTPLAYIADINSSMEANIVAATKAAARSLLISDEKLRLAPEQEIQAIPIDLLLVAEKPAPSPHDLIKINAIRPIKAILAKSVDKAVQAVTAPSLVMEDDFSGTRVNRQLWTCGFSRLNRHTQLEQKDGFIITIKQGGEYSGGAIVTRIPIHGAFDAQVDFYVANPCRATTFELAAIGIDPGYFNINDPLDAKKVHLTYDVHGAPPYASSERDEDDGFRIGWNNSFNLTRIDSDWQARSANMYNKYGRDVGYAKNDSPTGTLRLTRNGPVFNAYYQDKFNQTWVCSGAALVPNLGEDVYIRLAAKHWKKGGTSPCNQVIFRNFRLYQY